MEKSKMFWIIGALISGLLSYFIYMMTPGEGGFNPSLFGGVPGFIYGIFLVLYFSTQQKKNFISIQSLMFVVGSAAAFMAAYHTTLQLVLNVADSNSSGGGFTGPLFAGGIIGMLVLYAGLSFTFTRFNVTLFISSLFLSGFLSQAFTLGMYMEGWTAFEAFQLPILFLFVFWQVGMFLLIKKLSPKEIPLQASTMTS